ncbi:MAG: hypothetical protein CMP62_03795 [Flavobacteriales bacterium]|nr:hypothetical protein [Flavobacteriales bacterium]|tara:strand:- start:263 stop:1144 length:882 start_codon:yes stop_codon:yes gene_type:complete
MNILLKYLFLITLTSLILTNINCEDSLSATIPSYIEIQKFNYDGNSSTTPPHNLEHESVNISDAWVTMNGNSLGVFEIPCTIPILEDGLHSFDISPGIKVNGIAGTRIKYPFYKKYEKEITLERNSTNLLNPVTSYTDNTNYIYRNEGKFELPGDGTILEAGPLSDTICINQSEIVFQGTKSGAIYLDSINSYFEIRNIEALELELNTFLELNFKSNISFNIGLLIINGSETEIKQELIQIYPSEEWKKIYLDLSPLIGTGNMFSKFKIYFDGSYDNTQANNAIYLDNLKLVF